MVPICACHVRESTLNRGSTNCADGIDHFPFAFSPSSTMRRRRRSRSRNGRRWRRCLMAWMRSCNLMLFPLRLRQIDSMLAELQRSLGEPVSALVSFFGRCRRIDNLFDCLPGQFLSAQLPARLAAVPRWRLQGEPELDQAADGFGAARLIVLLVSPLVDRF